MPRLNLKNYPAGATSLGADLAAGATTCTVADGSKLPDPPFRLTVENEIIEVGAKDGNTLSSLLRGQEDTADTLHANGTGVEVRLTTGIYDELTGSDDGIDGGALV